jgi:hypothetical protein
MTQVDETDGSSTRFCAGSKLVSESFVSSETVAIRCGRGGV